MPAISSDRSATTHCHVIYKPCEMSVLRENAKPDLWINLLGKVTNSLTCLCPRAPALPEISAKRMFIAKAEATDELRTPVGIGEPLIPEFSAEVELSRLNAIKTGLINELARFIAIGANTLPVTKNGRSVAYNLRDWLLAHSGTLTRDDQKHIRENTYQMLKIIPSSLSTKKQQELSKQIDAINNLASMIYPDLLAL